MPHLVLRLLRVFVRPDGRLVFNHREGAYQPITEGWWRDVLLDRRAELPVQRDIPARSPNANYRVDRYKHAVVAWQCPACNHHGCPKIERDMLIREMGPATNVVWAVRELVGCRNRNKVSNMCRANPIL